MENIFDRIGVLQSLISCTFSFLMFMLVMTIACVPLQVGFTCNVGNLQWKELENVFFLLEVIVLQLKYMQKAAISPSACLHVPKENSSTGACIIYSTGNNTGLQIKDAEKWIRLNKSFWRAVLAIITSSMTEEP